MLGILLLGISFVRFSTDEVTSLNLLKENGEEITNPLVSVITPSYNSSDYIKETIASVKEQTYRNWEMIIVDDCSTDHSSTIIQEQAEQDSRIQFFSTGANSGAAFARNMAIKEAKGKYVAFLDSDDLWLPDKLEKQVGFMERKDLAFSFTAYRVMNQQGMDTGKIVRIPSSIDYKGLLKNTIIGCLTVMINTEKIESFKMPDIRTRQDYATWLSVLKRGYKAYGLQEPLSRYRVSRGSISSNKLNVAKRNWYIYRQVEGLNAFYASWCFVNYVFHAMRKRIF